MRVEGRGYMVNTADYEPVYIRASYDRINHFMSGRPRHNEMEKSVK